MDYLTIILIADTVVASITTNKLRFHCFYRAFNWPDLKIGHLIGWIWKCLNLLFRFCHLIGFHCLGGPGFSKRTAIIENIPQFSKLRVLGKIFEGLTQYIATFWHGNLLGNLSLDIICSSKLSFPWPMLSENCSLLFGKLFSTGASSRGR